MFASSNSVMGVRKTTDFLDKATWTLVAILAVLSVTSAAFLPDQAAEDETTKIVNKIEEKSPLQPASQGETASPLAPVAPQQPAAE